MGERVFLLNKYQSKQRINWRILTGVTTAPEEIQPENIPRIFGNTAAVYYNGGSAAGESSGLDEQHGEGGEEKPGGGGGSWSGECVCEKINDATNDSCCIGGFDCETGRIIEIQRKGDPQPLPPTECEPDIPTPTPEDPLVKLMQSNCINTKYGVRWCLKSEASGVATAFSAEGVSRTCPTAKNCNTYTYSRKIGNLNVKYESSCKSCSLCSGCIHIVACEIITSPNKITQEVIDYYKQNMKKRYFIKDGKIYDACDPYGQPPTECVEMCDEDGNKYQVCGDGSITAL